MHRSLLLYRGMIPAVLAGWRLYKRSSSLQPFCPRGVEVQWWQVCVLG